MQENTEGYEPLLSKWDEMTILLTQLERFQVLKPIGSQPIKECKARNSCLQFLHSGIKLIRSLIAPFSAHRLGRTLLETYLEVSFTRGIAQLSGKCSSDDS